MIVTKSYRAVKMNNFTVQVILKPFCQLFAEFDHVGESNLDVITGEQSFHRPSCAHLQRQVESDISFEYACTRLHKIRDL